MLSKSYGHPEERPKARLEGRKVVMQSFVSIFARPLSSTRPTNWP
jgi:hypothetical protein